eukprot:7700465-Ditylum_brightwellii.AAC.1
MCCCIVQGELREEILHCTIAPFIPKTVDDARAALDVAVDINIKDSTIGASIRPGALLQLIDCWSIKVITSKE